MSYKSHRTFMQNLKNYNSIKTRVAEIPKITTKPMFGYQCFSVSGKFFVGFSNKNDWQVIVRLPKDELQMAIKTRGIAPFSHGAKMGWIEIDSKELSGSIAMKWIKKAHAHAINLSKS